MLYKTKSDRNFGRFNYNAVIILEFTSYSE